MQPTQASTINSSVDNRALENTNCKYGSGVVGLHLLKLLLVVVVYACMELRSWIPKGNGWRDTLKSLHISLDLSVPVPVAIRLAVR